MEELMEIMMKEFFQHEHSHQPESIQNIEAKTSESTTCR